MNILFVHPNNDYTGSTKVLADVIKEKYYNDNCIALSLCFNDGFLSDIQQLEICKIFYPLIKGKSIPVFSSFISLIDRIAKFVKEAKQSDIIYINTIKPYYAAVIAQMMHKKIIWHIHEKYTTGSVTKIVYEYIQSHTDAHFIFVSKYVQNQYVISKNSTREIRYNRLPEDFTKTIEIRPLEKRERTNLLVAAGLSKFKGVYNFVELARSLPDYNFHLVLSCSEEEKEGFVKSTRPPGNVKIWSRQNDMHPFYYEADVIMNMTIPSLCVETFGMTILEGMAYGLPAIVPNVGGPIELVHNGVEGYTIDVTDFKELSDAIVKITSDKTTYEKFSVAALKRSQDFS